MTDTTPEHKNKKKFSFFKNPEKKEGKFMLWLKAFYSVFHYLSLIVGMLIITFFVLAFVVSSISFNSRERQDRGGLAAQLKLNEDIRYETQVKSKAKIFETLLTQSKKPQKEVVDFLSQQQNPDLKFSLTPITEKILELHVRMDYDDYLYVIEFEKNKMKSITVKNAYPFEIKYFQDKNQKFDIIEPKSQPGFKKGSYELKPHIRVELNK